MIYFDNAATSYPKPSSVYAEVERCIRDYCGNPGRSGHKLSLEAQKTVYDCRCELARMFDCKSEENVVFTLNTTYALNMAIKGLARSGDHIIFSNIEHNSVIRPVNALGCDYDIFDSTQSTDRIIAEIVRLIRPNTKMIIAAHKSNIAPLQNPISAIGRLCRQRGLLFICDAAQSAGLYPISIKQSCIDALCIPGHKGLYGIQGCGAVLFSDAFKGFCAHNIRTLAEGGNGVASLDPYMPSVLPDRLEAGTLPTPAIAGLLAGIREVERVGTDHIRNHQNMLYRRLKENLLNVRKAELYLPEVNGGQILLFNIKGCSPEYIAEELDKNGICVRAGFHCAPLAHKALGTGPLGAVRASFGAFNTLEETDKLASELLKLQ